MPAPQKETQHSAVHLKGCEPALLPRCRRLCTPTSDVDSSCALALHTCPTHSHTRTLTHTVCHLCATPDVRLTLTCPALPPAPNATCCAQASAAGHQSPPPLPTRGLAVRGMAAWLLPCVGCPGTEVPGYHPGRAPQLPVCPLSILSLSYMPSAPICCFSLARLRRTLFIDDTCRPTQIRPSSSISPRQSHPQPAWL